MLRALDGSVTPTLVEAGEHEGRPLLALSWCDAVDVHEAAAKARGRGPAGRDDLLEIVCAILEAYARIHEQGVVHGDVHPRNVLIDEAMHVTVIDFGLGRIIGSDDLGEPPRGGIDFFMEPELAARLLAGEPPLPADPLGEQYSIAALGYLLLTGAHAQRFSLEESEMLRQLVDDDPLPFSAQGVAGLHPVEEVLRRALAKDPGLRFEDLAAFAAAFRQATTELEPEQERQRLARESSGDLLLADVDATPRLRR